MVGDYSGWDSEEQEAGYPDLNVPAESFAVVKQPGEPAARLNLYGINFNEGGTPDNFIPYTNALRSGADDFNTGQVYVTPPARGGVRAGDYGILKTHSVLYYGVVRAGIEQRYNGYPTENQTLLDQWAGTPTRFDGDVPLDLQWQPTGLAPWLKPGTKR
jgi:hypothetical protein